jgi:hypothetical protein
LDSILQSSIITPGLQSFPTSTIATAQAALVTAQIAQATAQTSLNTSLVNAFTQQ